MSLLCARGQAFHGVGTHHELGLGNCLLDDAFQRRNINGRSSTRFRAASKNLDYFFPTLGQVGVYLRFLLRRNAPQAALYLVSDVSLACFKFPLPLCPILGPVAFHDLLEDLDLESLDPLGKNFQRIRSQVEEQEHNKEDSAEERCQQEPFHEHAHFKGTLRHQGSGQAPGLKLPAKDDKTLALCLPHGQR